jgi:hypothetical protein
METWRKSLLKQRSKKFLLTENNDRLKYLVYHMNFTVKKNQPYLHVYGNVVTILDINMYSNIALT